MKPLSHIKLLVTDLDDTLLSDDKTISARTVTALRRAKDQGITLAFASGRIDFMMELYREPLVPCDYRIAFGGGSVRRVADGHIDFVTPIDADATAAVWRLLADEFPQYVAYSWDHMYYRDDTESRILPRFDRYAELGATYGVELYHDRTKLAAGETVPEVYGDILKFVFYDDDSAHLAEFSKRVGRTVPGIDVEETGYGFTGIFEETVAKGNALRHLQEKLGIGPDRTCVFGDYDNDLSLFDAADHTVAVANASETLKQVARYITASNQDDGVAAFIERYIL